MLASFGDHLASRKMSILGVHPPIFNLRIGDETAIINHATDPTSNKFLGETGARVSSNMMLTCNYFAGLNPKIFQSKTKAVMMSGTSISTLFDERTVSSPSTNR
jgi:hypothetical protein